jgi:rsbT co-antagonist protein RsbR
MSDESEERFSPISSALSQMLLDAAPDVIVAINRDGIIVFANQQVDTTFGWTVQEVIGQHIEMLIPERFRDRHRTHRTGYFAYPRIRPMGLGLDLRGLHKNSLEFPVEISLSPVEGDLAIATVRDMTGRHRVTQEPLPSDPKLQYAMLGLQVISVVLLLVLLF